MPWRTSVVVATPMIALAITQAPIDAGPTDDGVSVSTHDRGEGGEHAATDE